MCRRSHQCLRGRWRRHDAGGSDLGSCLAYLEVNTFSFRANDVVAYSIAAASKSYKNARYLNLP